MNETLTHSSKTGIDSPDQCESAGLPDTPVPRSRKPSQIPSTREDWPEPILPQRDALKLPAFPIEVYSQRPLIKAFVEQLAAAKCTPVDFVGVGILPIVSASLMRRVTISPRADFNEPAMLYVAIGGEPASGKSQVFDDIMAPLEEVEEKAVSILREKYAANRADRSTLEEQIKSTKRTASKGGLDSEEQEELRRLNVRLEALPSLEAASMIIEDTTPEKAVEIAASREGCLMFASDEGTPFRIAGTQRCEAAVSGLNQLFKKGHSGGTHKEARISRGVADIKLFVSVLSMTQPDELTDLIDDRNLVGQGSLSRFLFSIPEEQELEAQDWNADDLPTVDSQTRNAYHRLIYDLSEVELGTIVKLTASANTITNQYLASKVIPLKNRTNKQQDHFLELFLAKCVRGGTVLRLALALHAMKHGKQLGDHDVSDETMANACKLYDYFIAHAQALRTTAGKCDSLELQVVEWLKQDVLDRVSKSEFSARWKRQLPRSRDRDEFCSNLEESGIIMKSTEGSKAGPKSTFYYVNPKIRPS